MKAIIVSSGEGSRLRPVTCSLPVSMLPIMGRPLAEHSARLLSRHNFNEVVFHTTYLADELKKHFATANIPDMKVTIQTQKSLDDYFAQDDTLLISDCVMTDIDLSLLTERFHSSPIIVTKSCEGRSGFGHVTIDSSLRVTDYKMCADFTHSSGNAFMGIMIVPKGTVCSDCKDILSLAEKLCGQGRAYVYSPQGYIRNISDFESYHRCCRDFMDKKVNLPFPCDEWILSVSGHLSE